MPVRNLDRLIHESPAHEGRGINPFQTLSQLLLLLPPEEAVLLQPTKLGLIRPSQGSSPDSQPFKKELKIASHTSNNLVFSAVGRIIDFVHLESIE